MSCTLVSFPVKSLILLSIISYNTHGLANIVTWDGAKERAEKISQKVNDFDIIFLQENFCYNDQILEESTHPYIARGKTTPLSTS